jgi:cell division septation protein DedD
MERKNFKTLSNLLSKTAGLVFFSFLAISLGVVFGLLFDGWVKDQPGAPVDSKNGLETVELPINSGPEGVDPGTATAASKLKAGKVAAPQSDAVKFRVRVGPYSNRDQALQASQKLQEMGYPIMVGKNPPFAIQVGAFGTRGNAEKLQNELVRKGYKSFIDR